MEMTVNQSGIWTYAGCRNAGTISYNYKNEESFMNAQGRYALRNLSFIFAFIVIFGGIAGLINVVVAAALLGTMVIIIVLTFRKIAVLGFLLGF
jgi:hypothetical protein